MIEIGIDPNLFSTGGLIVSWHGLFTFLGVATAVWIVASLAKQEGLDPDIVYSTAIWCIIGGVIGARFLHVVDNLNYYATYPGNIFAVWNGGIALFGAILGGLAAGIIYTKIKNYPLGLLADLTAPALLLAQFIGRIGDIINGEHIARATSLPWRIVYSHPGSPSFGLAPQHPAIAYEMIWDLIVLAVIWQLRGKLSPNGMLFVAYLAAYSLGRFFISFLRLDPIWFAGLQEAHIVSIAIMAFAVPLLAYKGRFEQK